MITTRYLDKFRRLSSADGTPFVLRGSTLLVELVEEEDVRRDKRSGLFVAQDSSQVRGGVSEHKLLYGVCVAAGEGYYDPETNTTTPPDIKVGDVVIIPKYGIHYISTFPGMDELTNLRLGMIKEQDILGYFRGLTGFEQARGVLNE